MAMMIALAEMTSGHATADSARPVFGSRALPEAVPYCGAEEDYFMGSGVSGVAGSTAGVWDFLIGPDYTSPNFIKSEVLSVIVDGKEQELSLKMHRGRKSGVFWGAQQVGDIGVYLIDFTNNESTWVGRGVRLLNTGTVAHTIRVRALVTPSDISSSSVSGASMGAPLGTSASIVGDTALKIEENTQALNFGVCNKPEELKNWADRYSHITFNVKSTVHQDGSKYEIITEPESVAPGGNYSCGLYHWQHYDEAGKTDADYINSIRSRNVSDDIEKSITEWSKWIDAGKMYADRITDPKARDVVEGSLMAIKMQQHRDGGLIASPKVYAFSYVRDTHGATRLFEITGHYEEVRKAIQEIDRKEKFVGCFPDAWQMGSNTYHYSMHRNESEIPAYFVLMTRDYYNETHVLTLPDSVYDTMKFAIDTQLDWMAGHNWVIDFNGDETEGYIPGADGQTYGRPSGWDVNNWSFSACVGAAASTQYFISYLDLKGNKALADQYRAKLKNVLDAIDGTFWNSQLNIHDWARKPDGGWFNYRITNYDNLPLWAGAHLNSNRENVDALAMKAYIDKKTGFLPGAPPDANGFCGHNLALMLYNLKKMDDPMAADVYHTIMNSSLIGCWGTVSEFYGPGGVPNGHNYRVFESGPNAEAIIRYFIGF
jgi:hypothetical protein